MADTPRVSVCMPTYNAEPFIAATLDSVLAQSERDIEVIVVDDGSRDATLAALRARGDERLQVIANERNLGAVPTTNRAMALSRGRYVKIVHADDALDEDCLEVMADALDRHPSAGLAFARRRVLVEGSGRAALWWANAHRELHGGFGTLAECNPGGELFDRWLCEGLESNWIGEPTSVMLRRGTLERVGLLSPRVIGFHDVDLWARMLLAGDAVFLDEPLTSYRTGSPSSLTFSLRASGTDWLQRLWLYEGLLADCVEGWRHEWLVAMRRNERLEVGKDALRTGLRSRAGAAFVVREVAAYAAYRLRVRLGRAPALWPPLPAK